MGGEWRLVERRKALIYVQVAFLAASVAVSGCTGVNSTYGWNRMERTAVVVGEGAAALAEVAARSVETEARELRVRLLRRLLSEQIAVAVGEIDVQMYESNQREGESVVGTEWLEMGKFVCDAIASQVGFQTVVAFLEGLGVALQVRMEEREVSGDLRGVVEEIVKSGHLGMDRPRSLADVASDMVRWCKFGLDANEAIKTVYEIGGQLESEEDSLGRAMDLYGLLQNILGPLWIAVEEEVQRGKAISVVRRYLRDKENRGEVLEAVGILNSYIIERLKYERASALVATLKAVRDLGRVWCLGGDCESFKAVVFDESCACKDYRERVVMYGAAMMGAVDCFDAIWERGSGQVEALLAATAGYDRSLIQLIKVDMLVKEMKSVLGVDDPLEVTDEQFRRLLSAVGSLRDSDSGLWASGK